MKSKEKLDKQLAVGLIRVSTDSQATEDKGGIPAQQEACRQIAAKNNLEIRWTIQIEGVSGARVRSSPEMEKLLAIVSSGQCSGVVLKEESRLMRPEAFGDYEVLGFLQKHNVKLYLLDETIDLNTTGGRLWASLKFGMAGYERSQIKERMMAGARAKRSRGEWVSGPKSVPLGFTIETDARKFKRLRVDPATIGKVQRLFQLFTEGVTSYTALSRETGISYYSIKYILKNEIYAGVHVVRRKIDTSGPRTGKDGRLLYVKYPNRLAIPVEDRERIPMLDKPPVSPEVFARAQRLLAVKETTHSRPKPGKHDPFLYRGFLRCAECKRNITTVRYVNRQANFTAQYYVCQGTHGACTLWDKQEKKFHMTLASGTCGTRRMRREQLETLLDEVVRKRLASREFYDEMVKGVEERPDDIEEREKNLRAEIQSLERQLAAQVDLSIRGFISPEILEGHAVRIKKEMALAQRALRKLKPNTSAISPEQWEVISEEFQSWDNKTPDQKRATLACIAPIFEVAGYPGAGYHETHIRVSLLHLNSNQDEESMVSVKLENVAA